MLEITQHNRVTQIQLNRPRGNAMNIELITALRGAVEQAQTGNTGAIVLSGLPGMFSGGLDIPSLIGLDRNGIRTLWVELFSLMRAFITSRIPTIAAVTGHAPAGGCVMAICCDYRVMAAEEKYKIGVNEVAVGIPMPALIHEVLTHIVGPHNAGRMCTTALLMTSTEALRMSLVDRLAPADRVVSDALDWATEIATLPASALQPTREMCRAELIAATPIPSSETLDQIVEDWFSDETQSTLQGLVDRLRK